MLPAASSRSGFPLLAAPLALLALAAAPFARVAVARSSPARARQDAPPAAKPLTYDEMVARLEKGDLSVDYTQLRLKYAATPGYEPEAGTPLIKPMYAALNQKDYKLALDTANTLLKRQYVNIDAHIIASLAYDGLADKSQAEIHHDIAIGLINSILHSGSGASTASPYVVISVAEEYALMRVMGWQPRKQSYLHEGKRSFDQMEVFDTRNNSDLTLYFDCTLSDSALEKALKH